MNNHKSFGETINHLRKKRKLTLKEVAESIPIDTSLLSKLEKNYRYPNEVQIKKFAKFFKVNEKELIIPFLSDKVVSEVSETVFSKEVLKVADIKIQYLEKKK